MKGLRIADNLLLPIDAVTQTFGIVGKRGSGKTYTAAVVAEEMLTARMQIVVLDPLDVWWGLKASADGRHEGYPVVVIGGEHGDLPLEPSGASLIADLVVDEGLSVILSMRHLSKSQQRGLVTDFAERLYYRKGKSDRQTPLHLFIDEADAFAPQRLPRGHERCFGAIDTVVRRGRSSGIGVTMITQRSASINKDVLSQAEVLIAHRTLSPQDRKAIESWIEHHDAFDQKREFLVTVARLDQGEAWIWSPGWLELFERVQIRERKTFDSSKTPEFGQRLRVPKRLARVDLDQLREKLAATVEKSKAEDPKALRREVIELKRQLAVAERRPTDVKAKTVEVPVLKSGERQAIQELGTATIALAESVREQFEKLSTKMGVLHAYHCALANRIDKSGPFVSKNTEVVPGPTPRIINRASSSENGRVLTKPEAAILRACYWLRAETPTKAKIAFYSGYSGKSSSIDKSLSGLRTKSLISGLQITPDGQRASAADAGEKPTGPTLREWLRPKLSRAENAMLSVCVEAYPNRLSKDDIAHRSDYSDKSSAVDKALSGLRSLEAIEGADKTGGMKAANVFFD